MKYALYSLTFLLVLVTGCGLDRPADFSSAVSPASPRSTVGCANTDLSDTLAWIDNTYNRHEDWAPGKGHKRYPATGKVLTQSTETFAVTGCQLVTLRIEESPYSEIGQSVYGEDTYAFRLRDVDPQSIEVAPPNDGLLVCDMDLPSHRPCNYTDIDFGTRVAAPLIEATWHQIYPDLKGPDHFHDSRQKVTTAYFLVEGVDYANRLAKAFRHAVELAGGKPLGF
jgi:hypothetical protein